MCSWVRTRRHAQVLPLPLSPVIEPDAPQVEQVREAHVELARAGGEEELVGRDLLAEGVAREGEVFAVHR